QGIPLPNGEISNVKWYQFKIPIKNPDKVIGGINDFKSIRFMRMFMTGFDKPVVLRFATLDLVRGEWRRYPNSEDLLAPGEYIPNSTVNETSFDISAVNIEENGLRTPIPYVIPPGINREVNIGTTNLTRLNEQSMVLKVTDLPDGSVAAGYKTTEFDFRQFKRLKMYIHGERALNQEVLKYGDLTVFIRIGSDFTQNYYEYEVPIKFTPLPGDEEGIVYSPENIWYSINEMNIDLEKLVEFKLNRNTEMRKPGSLVSLNRAYYAYDGNNKVTVLGSPSISDVQAIMIGVRNPKKSIDSPTDDSGEPISAEIWVNELRLTEFSKKSGWATTTRVNMNLADFGNVTVSGGYTSPWFGSIGKKITEIPLESVTQLDFATNLELGKFFPEKSGVRIPMHYDYSETTIKPEYNPLDPDLKLDDVLESYELQEDKKEIKKQTTDYTVRRNINFMNVRKDRTGGGQKKPKVWDVENFDVSYSYSEIYHRDVDIEFDVQKTTGGGIGYTYSTQPKKVAPFEKIGFIANTKALQLIKDFNFYFLPKMLSFRTDMNRVNNEKKLRKKSIGDVITFPTYFRTWDWNRQYDVKFDLAQSLSLDFNATANTFIDEPSGSLSKNDPDYDVEKQEIWNEILGGGTMNQYTQNVGLSYTIPVNKLPGFDWITSQFGYQVTYNWMGTPLSIRDTIGNSVQNNRNITFNGNADLNKLYNKIGFLKKVNESKLIEKKEKGDDGGKDARGGRKGDDGGDGEGGPAPGDSLKVKKSGINYAEVFGKAFLKVLMGFKKISFQYSRNDGTLMPGFMHAPTALGNNWNRNAPGMAFIFGHQPDGPSYFNNEGWLSTSSMLNTAFSKQQNENFNLKATFEPFKDLKIELTADKMASLNKTGFYTFNDSVGENGQFVMSNEMENGTYSISYISWRTAFGGVLGDDKSQWFENLVDNRLEIARRLAAEYPETLPVVDSTGYPLGYGPTSQYVLAPAFMAAYTGKSAGQVALTSMPKIPLPNWRLSYNGLSKIDFLKQWFKSITINHAYRSNYSLGSFTSNINYIPHPSNKDRPDKQNPNNGDFYSQYEIGVITINEQFSPLINFDMTLQNSLMTKFEIKKSRNLSLSFANNQLTEVINNEFTVGVGYRIKELPFTFSAFGGGGRRTITSDLNLKADVSIRTNKTVLRNIVNDLNQVSAGQQQVRIAFNADYMISQSLTIAFYFDKIITNPFLPSQFRNSTTQGGIKLRFSLAQ
ncbi:MAG: cell surface protein SprA, partial [Bacteroidales bacterium]|nr:cell surface protein SprA [Bacteroidales bacterium]